jgi:hypothetical protein
MFSHRFFFQHNLGRVMNLWVKDDIGQRLVLNGRMPVFHRQLTGDKGRASPMAVFKGSQVRLVDSHH